MYDQHMKRITIIIMIVVNCLMLIGVWYSLRINRMECDAIMRVQEGFLARESIIRSGLEGSQDLNSVKSQSLDLLGATAQLMDSNCRILKERRQFGMIIATVHLVVIVASVICLCRCSICRAP